MTKFKKELSHPAIRILERMARLEPKLYRRIANALDAIQLNPYVGKSLKGQLRNRYSYSVGNHRIISFIKKNILIVFVIDISHRNNIYS